MPALETIAVVAKEMAATAVEVGGKAAEVTVEEAKEITAKGIENAEKTNVVIEKLSEIKSMSPEQLRDQMERNLSEANPNTPTEADEDTQAKKYFTDEQKQRIKEETGWSGEITDNIENMEQYELDKNELSEKGKPIQNKIDGLQREADVRKDLENQYPSCEGNDIISEAYLRDENGNIVKDAETGKARRIDFVVVKDGKVIDSIEVTSETANKTDQIAKETRIRDNGGNYIKDNDGKLIRIPNDVNTRIERRK